MATAGSRLVAARALAYEALLAEIVPALRERGVRPLLIKGPVTVDLLYREDPHLRDADDIDLLVSEADFNAAEAVLAECGFRNKMEAMRPSEVPLHEHAWVRDGPLPVTVDLHRALRLVPDGAALFELLSRDACERRFGAAVIAVPSEAASTLIIALHAAHHTVDSPRALEDLSRAVRQLPEDVWRDAAALAAELGVSGELRLGLETVPEGSRVLAWLPLADAAPLRWRVRREGAKRLVEIFGTRDLRRAIRLFRDGLVPSPTFLRTYSKVPVRPGRAGLLAAYVRRWSLIPAVLAQVAIELSRPLTTRLDQALPARLARYLRTLAWAAASARRARRQLQTGNLASVTLPPAPLGGRGAPRGLRDGLRLARPSCLERSLVRRAWHLRQGRDIRIVIGVRGSGDSFGAHAWLQGDPPEPLDFAELLVWPGEQAPRETPEG